ncbi:MAG: hypothetical protein AB7G13_24925 [Lautropia sp.]
MVTTDHISPIGVISPGTPSDRYLQALGIARKGYVNYAARRLNHDVMIRGQSIADPAYDRAGAGPAA